MYSLASQQWVLLGDSEGHKTCHFFAMKGDRAGDLSLPIFVGDTFCKSLLQIVHRFRQILRSQKKKRFMSEREKVVRTLLRTAMEA
jgi:hypothetical protein